MTAYQMISYSAYLIFTSDYNEPARQKLNDYRKDQNYFSKSVKK